MPRDQITLLLRLLEQAFDGKNAWQGANVKNALRGMDAELAEWRPQHDRHNIRELVVHMAYWKYISCRHICDTPPQGFDREGSNWFPLSESSNDGWKDDKNLLIDWHGRLYEAVSALHPKKLSEHAYDKYTVEEVIRGIAAHDIYHTGQIQLVKVMWMNN